MAVEENRKRWLLRLANETSNVPMCWIEVNRWRSQQTKHCQKLWKPKQHLQQKQNRKTISVSVRNRKTFPVEPKWHTISLSASVEWLAIRFWILQVWGDFCQDVGMQFHCGLFLCVMYKCAGFRFSQISIVLSLPLHLETD